MLLPVSQRTDDIGLGIAPVAVAGAVSVAKKVGRFLGGLFGHKKKKRKKKLVAAPLPVPASEPTGYTPLQSNSTLAIPLMIGAAVLLVMANRRR